MTHLLLPTTTAGLGDSLFSHALGSAASHGLGSSIGQSLGSAASALHAAFSPFLTTGDALPSVSQGVGVGGVGSALFHAPAAPLAAAISMGQSYLPVLLMILVALGFAAGTIVFSGIILPRFFKKLKPNNPSAVKMAPYECGIPVTDDARASVFVRFYLVALLFLLFDMETIYVVVWALIFRGSLTTPGAMVFLLAEMGMFLAILLVGYAYAWKKGALTWS